MMGEGQLISRMDYVGSKTTEIKLSAKATSDKDYTCYMLGQYLRRRNGPTTRLQKNSPGTSGTDDTVIFPSQPYSCSKRKNWYLDSMSINLRFHQELAKPASKQNKRTAHFRQRPKIDHKQLGNDS